MTAQWVYLSDDGLHTVGFYSPTGQWVPESDHETKEAAVARVHHLNGGCQNDKGGDELSKELARTLAAITYYLNRK